MDGDAEGVEFPDWEVLQKSEEVGPALDFVGIESDSDGVIRSDYFSLDGHSRYAKADHVTQDEDGSIDSDNPSWIDPAPYATKNSPEFWSDSSTEDRKFADFDATNELCPGEMEADHNQFETKFTDLDSNFADKTQNQLGLRDFEELQIWDKSSEKCFSDSGGDDLIKDPGYGGNNDAKMPDTSQFSTSELDDKLVAEEEHSTVAMVELKSGGDGEKKRVVWWKVPFEVIKYCIVRVSPVWSFSVAAAFVGFIILGRRLYKMKRKSQSLKLKVAVDDKKVYQFMGRAARLNEAFSVVRRVPIIRPSIPSSTVTPWPVMSMR